MALDLDGVTCARQLLNQEFIESLREAVEEAIAFLKIVNSESIGADQGFSGDIFVWKLHDAIRDASLFSSLPALAQQILGTQTVRFFYDQFFVKRAGCPVETPWHQDIPFWPVQGEQIVSFWITLDSVTRESSGLEFVKGSHRWGERFKAVPPTYDGYLMDTDMLVSPDFGADPGEQELLGWDMEPGDVLIFGPVISHGSQGNASNAQDRRAISLRYLGEDVCFAPRHATMPLLWEHGLEPGDSLTGSLFPQVWPQALETELRTRMAGPELPSDVQIEHFRRQLIDHGFGAGGDKHTAIFSDL